MINVCVGSRQATNCRLVERSGSSRTARRWCWRGYCY